MDSGALNWAINTLGVKSYIDIGCGPGGMVELAESKNLRVLGVDGDYTLKRYNSDNFVIHDYTTGPAPVTDNFDLAWSVEFVEHVYEKYIPNYMDTFIKAKYVIMTYAPIGHGGHHHVNENTERYWISKFKEYGFTFKIEHTAELRRHSTMNKGSHKAFVAKTGLLFKNTGQERLMKKTIVPMKENKETIADVEVVLEEQHEFDFDYDTYGHGGSENFAVETK